MFSMNKYWNYKCFSDYFSFPIQTFGGSYVQLKKLNLVPKSFNLVPKKFNLVPQNFNLVQKKQFSAEKIQLGAQKFQFSAKKNSIYCQIS